MTLLCLIQAPHLRGDTISGTVKDPSDAVVIGGRIEISGDKVLSNAGSGSYYVGAYYLWLSEPERLR